MNRTALVHAAAALLLAASALGSGALGAFIGAPLCLASAAQAVAIARGAGPEAARRSVGLGLAVLLLAAGFLLTGSLAAAAGLLVAGFAVGLAGTQLALTSDPPPSPLRIDLRLRAGVVADESIRLALELHTLLHRGPESARSAEEARIAADRNREEGWLARPERAYPLPPPLEKPRLMTGTLRGVGVVEHLSFASEFEPQDPEIRSEYLAAGPNRTAHAYLLRDRGEPRPTLVYVHGYAMGGFVLDMRALGLPGLCRRLGLDLALFVLPLHGPRSPGRRSGAQLFAGHPLRDNAALGQAVWDLRRLAGFLRDEGAPRVGVLGVSLGGYAAAVFASVDERLACAVSMCAPSSLAQLLWRQLAPRERDAARAAGLTPHVLENAWARHAPLRMRPRVPHAARLVVGGLADRIVPPAQVTALWEHWGQPAVHWYPGTHVAWLGLAALRQRIAAHLRDTLIPAG